MYRQNPSACWTLCGSLLGVMIMAASSQSESRQSAAGEFPLTLRYEREIEIQGNIPEEQRRQFEQRLRVEKWPAEQTAVIVCDVWDYHHCLNAVRRLEEFAPRLNELLKEARRQGAVIIHSPSDCMPAYEDHPARRRATTAPKAKNLPADIASWCSRIPTEEKTVYPIDQSDGGEDDDPAEHAEWAAKLKGLGRNPAMPWKAQSKLIEIDGERDYISDRGDEVWNILEARGIQNVILTGVHTNMCVLGRPFGLRQMVRNGKQVVLVRDMTDCMYNPKRWPFVDHFSGNDLIIRHVERFVCPTITSDQLLGGQPFRSKTDTRTGPIHNIPVGRVKPERSTFEKDWSLITIPSTWEQATGGAVSKHEGVAWYRCSLRIPASWTQAQKFDLAVESVKGDAIQAWINGKAANRAGTGDSKSVTMQLPKDAMYPDDINLLVLRVDHARTGELRTPIINVGTEESASLRLKGRWQFRLGDDPAWSNIPLPAKFGASPDILFEPAK